MSYCRFHGSGVHAVCGECYDERCAEVKACDARAARFDAENARLTADLARVTGELKAIKGEVALDEMTHEERGWNYSYELGKELAAERDKNTALFYKDKRWENVAADLNADLARVTGERDFWKKGYEANEPTMMNALADLAAAKEREISHTKAVGESASVLLRERDEARQTISVHADSIAYLKGELDKEREKNATLKEYLAAANKVNEALDKDLGAERARANGMEESFYLEDDKVEKARDFILNQKCSCTGEGVGTPGGCDRCRALDYLSTFGWDFKDMADPV